LKRALRLTTTLLVVLVAGCNGGGSDDGGPVTTAATTDRLSANMTPDRVVTPRNRAWRVPSAVANVRGTFSATLKGAELAWRINYTGLANEPLVIADIHAGKPGSFGPVAVRLCDDCKSGQRGTKRLSARELELLRGDSWVTLITGRYPNGVIRGQISTR
jgi:hypothetical protein